MARIKFTALVESIRGSIQGTTFQANAYGFTVKAKPNMLNPNTPNQNYRKGRFAQAIQLWQSLTASEREAWNTYANTYPIASRNNPSSYLSGFNAFGRWHAVAATDNLTTLADPSGAQGTCASNQIDLIISGGNLFINVEVLHTNGPWRMQVFLTRPLKYTQEFVKSWTRFIAGYAATSFGTDLNISSAYIAKFGSLPIVGDILGVKIVYYNTTNGQVYFEPTVLVTVTA